MTLGEMLDGAGVANPLSDSELLDGAIVVIRALNADGEWVLRVAGSKMAADTQLGLLRIVAGRVERKLTTGWERS